MKRKMCDHEVNLPLSPSNRPQFQLHPSTSEKILNSDIQKRMQEDSCFKCDQKGYWSWFCPFYSPNNKPLSSSSSHSPIDHLPPQNIHCRCGYGFCIIKTCRSDRNPGRKYYACPVQRGAQCKGYGFMKWCDEPVDESDLQPPLFKYLVCECGAGVCRRVKGTEQSTNVVKYYFECPVKKNHGSCGYQVLEDEVLNNTSSTLIRQSMSKDELNNRSITPIRKSRQRSLDEFYQNVKRHKTENGLGDQGGRFHGQTKMMDNYEFLLTTMDISEIPEGEDAGVQEHKGSTPETSPHSSSHHPFPSYNSSPKQTGKRVLPQTLANPRKAK